MNWSPQHHVGVSVMITVSNSFGLDRADLLKAYHNGNKWLLLDRRRSHVEDLGRIFIAQRVGGSSGVAWI